MCLLSVAWKLHPDYPLIFVGNRDEYHARPTAAADWWDEYPAILGGRDLAAGGSWLGISRQGRLAVVTNRPDLPAPAQGARSRGELVTRWLTNEESFTEKLRQQSQHYGGFSLLLAESGQLQRVSGGNGTRQLTQAILPPGINGLSNTAVDQPWPKLRWLNQQLEAQLTDSPPNIESLMGLLMQATPVPGSDTGAVSGLPFVTGEHYGTRSSSVVTINASGACQFVERRFGPNGQPLGESAYEFDVQG